MRIFVTGATGFLGSHLLRHLGGHEVLCLTRSPGAFGGSPHVTAVTGDLNDGNWLPALEAFAADCCIHLAWQGLPDYSLRQCRHNLNASLTLIDALVRARVSRVVVAGSCWEYGAANGAVAEADAPLDCGVFASTKHAFRGILESVAREQGIDSIWARIFFVYGPGQRETSLIPLCHAAYSRGESPQIRQPRVAQDFIHVDDVAAAMLALADSDAAAGVYNLGSGRPASVGAVVNKVAAHFDAPAPFVDEGFESGFWADTRKITAATGWRPGISLTDGVTATLQTLDRAS